MLFAEISAEDWRSIITVIGTVIVLPLGLQVTQMILAYFERNALRRDIVAAQKETKDHLVTQDENQVKLAADVKEVHKIANSLSDKRQHEAEEAGRAKGALDAIKELKADEGLIAQGIVEGRALADAEKAAASARGETVQNGHNELVPEQVPAPPIAVRVENTDRIKVDPKP